MVPANPEELGFSTERLKRINDYMRRYVSEGKVAGFVTLVARRGKIAYFDKFGYRDIATETPMELDTIFRIYSMTKPITNVAFMMLFEKGLVRLEDPVTKYIPEFKNLKILGPHGELESPRNEITVHMLMTHTAGLCYAEWESPVLAKYYIEPFIWDPDQSLEEFVKRITNLPHKYHPGDTWHYSMATDVVGRLVEIIADMPIADFFEEKIFKPLGMVDTAFSVPKEKEDRFANLYGPDGNNLLAPVDVSVGGEYSNPKFHIPGHGLVSTAEDYFNFAQMVLNKGEFDGVRLLGPRTVEYMTINHLKPDLLPWIMDVPWHGMGFGLGISVVMDPALAETMSNVGTIGWGGAASTNFWIDPVKEIIGILLLQIWPSYTYPTTNDFRTAVYQAMLE
jgi:CubicO group peptidase (beta-lactamase class C family)